MITLEEAKAQGLVIAGTEPYPDFVVGSKAYKTTNSKFARLIQNELNKKFKIVNYCLEIKHLTIIFLIYPEDWNGVNWQERKYFARKEKHFYMDLKITDYNAFCNANQAQALDMLQYELLRGIDTYLSKVKGFDAKRLSNDVIKLLNC
jgi:hypothetical protein